MTRQLRTEVLRKAILGADGLAITLTVVGRPRMEPYCCLECRSGTNEGDRHQTTVASKELTQAEAADAFEQLAQLMRGNLLKPERSGWSKSEKAA